jgi:hypothetical protein
MEHEPGDVIETNLNLAVQFNQPKCKRFELLQEPTELLDPPDVAKPEEPEKPLEKMNKAELITRASELSLEIQSSDTNREIREMIEQAGELV